MYFSASNVKGKWLIAYSSYEGLEAIAVNKISGAISGRTEVGTAAHPIREIAPELLANNNIFFIGKASDPTVSKFISDGLLDAPTASQGYSYVLCDSPYSPDCQIAVISGYDGAGVLYGAIDFINHYIGTEMYRHGRNAEVTQNKYHEFMFKEKKMATTRRTSAPVIKQRAIWTWGHCIYDYRRFFENMLNLKLNQVVIWNDFAPLNGRQIVEYAHSLGISVYWGFSWGWGNNNNCLEEGESIDSDALIDRWTEAVYREYADQYAEMGADGIYFQSFTETKEERLNGVLIAAAVVKWVNRISARLFAAYPDLDIEFGLHATSVNTHLEEIAKVDPRISIVWEDCGAFPYNYSPEALSDFDETVELNRTICTLRGEGERFGAVLKGMVKLDWQKFENQTGTYVMGECDVKFITERTHMKEKIWRNIQSYWMENAEYAQKIISDIAAYTNGNSSVQMLVEDGCFESGVYFPVALCSELLWQPEGSILKLIGETARIPSVRFANL